jgi:hypothetical protein
VIRADDFPTLLTFVTLHYNQTALTIDMSATSYDRARKFCEDYPDARAALHEEAIALHQSLDDPADAQIIIDAALPGEFRPRTQTYAEWLEGVIAGSAHVTETTD